MAGIIQATSIEGSLDAKNIVMGVLTHAYEQSNLKEIARFVDVPKLDATVPIQIGPAVEEDVDEFVDTPIRTGEFKSVKFSLKKDRVRLVATDESRYRASAGDPLQLQIGSSGDALAQALDKKIAMALEVDPQTDAATAAWSTVTNNPLIDLSIAFAKLRPYRADYVVMTSDVWAAFAGNDYTSKFTTGAPDKLSGVVSVIPGLNLKVYVSDDITAKTCLVGASGAPSVAVGNGPVKVRTKDLEQGGELYQVDVWRQAVAPIMKDDLGLNKAVFQLTGVIA
jgi:hypothetical protein